MNPPCYEDLEKLAYNGELLPIHYLHDVSEDDTVGSRELH